jgi:hypothetical protein
MNQKTAISSLLVAVKHPEEMLGISQQNLCSCRNLSIPQIFDSFAAVTLNHNFLPSFRQNAILKS